MMQNSNYYKKMEEQLELYDKMSANGEKKRLLLHCCCAPCSSHCLYILARHFDITAYFYNPNITDYSEYIKRFDELNRFVNKVYVSGVSVYMEDHDPEVFIDMAKGKEHLPERSARCYDCYRLRLYKSAAFAKENGYDIFTTTLSISPHKNAEWLNEIGEKASLEFGVDYLYSDFKKKDGYRHSILLSKEYDLYRQSFCGCEYSRRNIKKPL